MENGKHIKVLTLQFDTEIATWEIPAFRGAVLASIGQDIDILFHNHTDDNGFRYSYPLIQYKRIDGKAAIVCVHSGVDSIGQFLSAQAPSFVIGNRPVNLTMKNVRPQNVYMQTWQSSFSYRLQHWIPLNSENYRRYIETDSLNERISLLESILCGNLLSMCKGLGIHLSEELTVKILRLSDPHIVKVKGVKVLSFDADFKTNLSIPDSVGIGKNVSLGFGTIRKGLKERDKKITNIDNNESNDK